MKARSIIGVLAAAACLSMMTACGSNAPSKQSEASVQSKQSEISAESKQSEVSTQSGQSEASTESKPAENSGQSEASTPEKDKTTSIHTLYVRDNGKSKEMTATFTNTGTGKTEDVVMKQISEGDDYVTYSCEADTAAYNMVHVTYDGDVSKDVAFNKYVNGWYLWNGEFLPYIEGQEPVYDPTYETKVFQFNGYDKEVYIWTPKDYDAQSAEKYSTIYTMDGQSVLTINMEKTRKCWNVSEHVQSMMSVTDDKAIIVAINTGTMTRDEELIPDLGVPVTDTSDFTPHGNEFADFICDTIMPYIQENYNVYTDPLHNAVVGSSLGGLESFYASMEHPDKFGTAGVFSPSFWTYDEETWLKYLGSKDFTKTVPFLYVYAGSYSQDGGIYAEAMYNALLGKNYPKDKIVFSKYEPGEHEVPYWRNIFPEFLEAVFTQKVSALECGIPVRYINTTNEMEQSSGDSSRKSDSNYVYYDNSETKWEKVFAYWWSTATRITNKITGEDYYMDWPGTQMEQIEGTDIYRVALPVGATAIIFDSGVTDDEVAAGVTAYQTKDLLFNANANAGQIYKIDVSHPAKKGTGFEKTKYKYSEGNWLDYDEG